MAETFKPSLIVVLRLPKGKMFPTSHSLPVFSSAITAADVAALPKYDRKFWEYIARSSHPLSITEVLTRMGIKHAAQRTRFRRAAVFGGDSFTQLGRCARELAAKLPHNVAGIVDFTLDPASLNGEVSELLERFGAAVWGGNQSRPWLLMASDGVKGYPKDLVFERKHDKEVLAYHIRLWILLKGFNIIRNKAYPKVNVSVEPKKRDPNWTYGNPRSKKKKVDKEPSPDPTDVNDNSGSATKEVDDEQAPHRFKWVGYGIDRRRDWDLPEAYVSSSDDDPVATAGPGNGGSYTPPGSPSKHTHENPIQAAERIFNDAFQGPIAEPGQTQAHALAMAKKDFPLNAYWKEASWRRFVVYNHVSIPTIIACLGLACRRVLHVGLVLDHSTGTALQVAVGRIAMDLSEDYDVEEMPVYAADPNFLDEEIEELFYQFAERLWGTDSNRKLLLTPGTDSAYPKHLVYENDADRKLLWIHMHRWIFATAFVLLRPNKPHSRIPSQAPSSKSSDDSSTNGKKGRGAGASTMASKSTSTQNTKETKRLIASTVESQAPPPKKVKTEEFTDIPLPVRKASPTTPNVGRIRRRILGYLDAYGEKDFDEASALEGMNNEYHVVASLLKGPEFPDNFTTVLNVWLDYRYMVLAIKTSAAEVSDQKLTAMETKIKRMRLVTALRVARDEFMAAGDDSMAADVVMILGIANLAKKTADRNSIVDMLELRFEKLDAELVKLAVELGDVRGGKWIIAK